MKTFRNLLVLSSLLVTLSALGGAPSRDFTQDSLTEIVKARSGRPFLLVFWSLDCPTCLREMPELASQRQKHPELEIVMVSTDDADLKASADALLQAKGLGAVESWIFSTEDPQRLRYGIDPSWYGELPRSYFYDRQHHRIAFSGAITAAEVESWLSAGRF